MPRSVRLAHEGELSCEFIRGCQGDGQVRVRDGDQGSPSITLGASRFSRLSGRGDSRYFRGQAVRLVTFVM
jgi:hypothetical protein